MRKLIVTQKLISLREQYSIADESGQELYQAEGSLLVVPKRFTIRDRAGNELATVRRQPISILPQFNLSIGGQQVAVIQKQISLIKPRYRVDGPGLAVRGDIFNMSFEILKDGRVIGRVDKRWVSIRDVYAIEVYDERDEILALGIVLAIDYVKRLESRQRSSSDD